MKNRHARRGFTLIELLVVVLIIGILAAVALPQYQKAVYRSRYATLKHLAASLAQAEEVYFMANNSYSPSIEALDIDMPSGKLNTSTTGNYKYNWGSCAVYASGSYQVECIDYRINMGYVQRLAHDLGFPHAKYCTLHETSDLTDWRNQICKMETGAESGESKPSWNGTMWQYQ